MLHTPINLGVIGGLFYSSFHCWNENNVYFSALFFLLGFLLLFRWLSQQFHLSLINRVILITGCDTGFGRMLAIHLDSIGARVIATCLKEESCEQLCSSCSENLIAFTMDVTDSSSIARVYEQVKRLHPEGIWGLVNNAGIARPGFLDVASFDNFAQVVDINLLGTVRMAKQFIPLLAQQTGSRIVNIASVSGRISSLYASSYNASKCAVEGFSDALRIELRGLFGINVVILEPGCFRTNIWSDPVSSNFAERQWEALSKQRKQFYGRELLMAMAEQSSGLVNTIGQDPIAVIERITHALSVRLPFARYSVGWDAHFIFLPLSYVPTFITDFIFGAIFYAFPRKEKLKL